MHNESLRTAAAVQAGEDDHVEKTDAIAKSNMDYMTKTYGTTYTYIPDNSGGQEVQGNFAGQMAQNGSVSVPAGAIHTSQGFYIPKQGSAELAATQTKDFNGRGQFWGQSPVNQGVVTGPAYDQLQHTIRGLNSDGTPMHADDIQNRIDGAQTSLASYQKTPNADPAIVAQTQTDIANLQAKQKTVAAREAQAITAGATNAAAAKTIEAKAAANTPQGIGAAALQQSEIGKNNAEAQKALTEKPQDNDANGNPIWRPGVTANQKTKAGLADNMVGNINSVNAILARRPDLVGAAAGRFTSVEQMIGTDDKDIVALGTAVHNIAMANNGIHGMKSIEGVHDFENLILNKFKNGPQAVAGGLAESAKSVQTFYDEAHTATYRGPGQGGQQSGGQSGKSVSLAAARQLPSMQGKTDAQITSAIQAQGHQVSQ
jgi:hypothetical protein